MSTRNAVAVASVLTVGIFASVLFATAFATSPSLSLLDGTQFTIVGWNPATPPADWASVRDAWDLSNRLRTVPSLLAFALQTIAMLSLELKAESSVDKRKQNP